MNGQYGAAALTVAVILVIIALVIFFGDQLGLGGSGPTATQTVSPIPAATSRPATTVAPVVTPVPVTPAPTVTPAAATASPAANEMPAAVITQVEPDAEAFIVHWDYPSEGAVVPTDFDVVVDGEVYERVAYEGAGFPYSWYVGEQPCGATLEVQIVAVNGDVTAASELEEATTQAC